MGDFVTRTGGVRTVLVSAAFVLGFVRVAQAHSEVEPPVLLGDESAVWPEGHALPNDLIVAVVLTVSAEGLVEAVELEAGVGEPFDSRALEAARRFRFKPAQDAAGPRRARVRGIVRFLGVRELVVLPETKGEATVEETRAAAPSQTPPSEPAVSEPASAEQALQIPPTSKSTDSAQPGTEIVVRGATPPRSASEAVLEKPLLEAAPHENAGKLLLTVPGVFVSQHGGEGKAQQIFFRGFDAAHGQDVELWAGGAPVNEVSNIHGQGYADLHFLIPEVIREIRSTPGTYDPRQGDFAVAGTLRMALGYDEPGVTAKAELGSFGTRRYFLAYHPKDAPPETFGAFELANTDGFGPSRAARHASGIGQAAFELGDGVGLRLMASTYAGRFDSAGVLRLDDVESNAIGRFDTYDPKQGGESSRTQLVAELSHDGKANGDAVTDRWVIAPFAVFRSLGLRQNFTGYLTSTEGDSIQQLNDTTTLGATASYVRPLPVFSDGDTIEAGISLRSDSIRQSQHRLSLLDDRVTDDQQTKGVDAEIVATNVAGYLDASVRPMRRVSLRGGLRADGLSYRVQENAACASGATQCTNGAQARSALGGLLSKRATLEVRVLPGLSALVSYGEGFRSPQARSLGDGETTPFTRVVSYETGLRYQQGNAFLASLAAYRTELSDDLVFDQSTARNELVPGTSRQGVALNLLAQPKSWLLSSASFTYARAVFDESSGAYAKGELLPYVPQIVARSDLALTPVLGQFAEHELRSHLGLGLTYLGRRPLPYGEYGHDVFLADARASLRSGPLETGLDVFNLLGRDWYDGEFVYASDFGGAASLVPVRHVTVGAPRTFLWYLSCTL